MARVQPGNSLVFRGFHQREKRTSKDERRRVMTEEISGSPGKTNRQTTRKILKYTYRKESKKLENYRDVRPWSTLKLANFPIFFSSFFFTGEPRFIYTVSRALSGSRNAPYLCDKKHERGGRVATIWDTFTSGAGFFAGYARQNRWAKLGQVLCVSGHRCDWYERSKGIWSRSSPLTLFITNFSLFFFVELKS